MPCTTPGHAVADGRAAGRLDAHQLGFGVVGEAGEDPDGVGAAADAGHDHVGQAAAGAARRHCARASLPITRWNSRTIHGYGCGPMTEPRQ